MEPKYDEIFDKWLEEHPDIFFRAERRPNDMWVLEIFEYNKGSYSTLAHLGKCITAARAREKNIAYYILLEHMKTEGLIGEMKEVKNRKEK